MTPDNRSIAASGWPTVQTSYEHHFTPHTHTFFNPFPRHSSPPYCLIHTPTPHPQLLVTMPTIYSRRGSHASVRVASVNAISKEDRRGHG
ncbi:unnamed protein product [Protopolystoma xenopodis]|uniref:Uncharacterized protein n=1 Tax=Protopolystoma xenopodis TaxID=117903 RepID=A0A3S5AKI5_9PLAT|nr:unnamed protein product [Protopolystoma xenopodis]